MEAAAAAAAAADRACADWKGKAALLWELLLDWDVLAAEEEAARSGGVLATRFPWSRTRRSAVLLECLALGLDRRFDQGCRGRWWCTVEVSLRVAEEAVVLLDLPKGVLQPLEYLA